MIRPVRKRQRYLPQNMFVLCATLGRAWRKYLVQGEHFLDEILRLVRHRAPILRVERHFPWCGVVWVRSFDGEEEEEREKTYTKNAV